MNKRTLISNVMIGFYTLLWASVAHAGMPLWTFTPLTPTTLQIVESRNYEVDYMVQNHSPKFKKLAIIPLQGIKQIAPCQLTPKGQANDSCVLKLAISGKELPAAGINGGPTLCQLNPDGSPNPNQCYRPNASNSLNITRSSAVTATISVTPTRLQFVESSIGVVTVINSTSSPIAATNVVVIIPSGSHLSVQSTTCGASLAIGGSCSITFTSPVAEGLTNIAISGSNTNTASVGVTVTATPTAMLSVTPTTLQFVESSTGFVTVTNSGSSSVAATGVVASIPGGSNITVQSTTCGASLPIGGSCSITFTSPVAEGLTNIAISGSNTNTASVGVTVTATPQAMLSVVPTTLQIAEFSTGLVTVTNSASSPFAATDVAAIIPGGSGLGIQNTDCGSTLAIGDTCTITFSSSGVEAPTTVPIAGTNTTTANVSIEVVTRPAISISGPSQGFRIVSVFGGQLNLMVTNTGTVNAEGITVTAHTACPNLQVLDNDCSPSVAGGQSCTLGLLSTDPYVPCLIIIEGTNTLAPIDTYIAFQSQGGLVYSTQGGRVSVVGEFDQPSSVWGTMGVETFASSIVDGLTNTSQIVSALGGAPSAAKVCDDLSFAGFNDWYLPAICELGYRSGTNPSPGCFSIPFDSTVYNLQQLGFLNLSFSGYWSSTEYSLAPPVGPSSADDAWSQSGSTGDLSVFNKDNNQNVRCVRSY